MHYVRTAKLKSDMFETDFDDQTSFNLKKKEKQTLFRR